MTQRPFRLCMCKHRGSNTLMRKDSLSSGDSGMTDEMQDDKGVQSVALAGVLMADLAGNLCAKFDTFATWLLAGFGAAVALLLTSHEALAVVSPATIRYGAKLFLAAVFVTVIEKYLSIIVAAGSEGPAFSRTTMQEYFKQRRQLGLPSTLHMTTFVYRVRAANVSIGIVDFFVRVTKNCGRGLQRRYTTDCSHGSSAGWLAACRNRFDHHSDLADSQHAAGLISSWRR